MHQNSSVSFLSEKNSYLENLQKQWLLYPLKYLFYKWQSGYSPLTKLRNTADVAFIPAGSWSACLTGMAPLENKHHVSGHLCVVKLWKKEESQCELIISSYPWPSTAPNLPESSLG